MVGKKFNVSDTKIRELYEEVKNKTNDFKLIEPSILSENSQRILIFRLAMNMSSEKFANLCKRTHGSIENLERTPKPLNYSVASHYIDIIKSNLQNANFQMVNILQTFRRFRDRAMKGISVMNKEDVLQFARTGAMESVKKRKLDEKEYFRASLKGVERQQLTNQEKRIKNILDENKVKYKVHEFVCGENLDFTIEDNKTILIGCSSSKINNLTHHARRLMYQGYRVKYQTKNDIIFIGILGKKDGVLKKSEVPIGAKKLLNEICDSWFVDENLNELINFIKTGS